MDKSLFRYVWRHSKRDQIIICAVVMASLPFYFASLDLPRRIVNEAIQGKALRVGAEHCPVPVVDLLAPELARGRILQGLRGFRSISCRCSWDCRPCSCSSSSSTALKYWINVSKGALGERMLRRMRFELFALSCGYPRGAAPREGVRDGDHHQGRGRADRRFIGRFICRPSGTQAATALIFIFVQTFGSALWRAP
jgi:putative ABC transport system ATP-binding protein